MSDVPESGDATDVAIGLFLPPMLAAMRAVRAQHPGLALPALAGAAAMVLRLLAVEDAAAAQARPDAGELVPRSPSAVKLDMIAEFTLAMRGSNLV